METPSDRVITGTPARRWGWGAATEERRSAGLVLLAASAALMVLLPVVTFPGLTEFDQKRLAELLLLSVAAACAVASSTLRRHALTELAAIPRSAWTAIAIIAALGLASSLRSASPAHALAEMGLMGALALYSVTLAGALRPVLGEARRWFLLAVMGMLSLYLVHTAAAYVAWLTTVQMPVVELLSGLGNPRFFGHWQTLTLPLTAVPIFALRSRLLRASALLIAVGWWAIAFGAAGRGTLIAATVAPVLIAVLLRRARRWCLVHLLCALLGLGLSYAMFQLPAPSAEVAIGVERLADHAAVTSSNESRLVLLVESADLVLRHPLLGIGPMHFAAVGERGHPHNLVAQFAVEWGLPATGLLLALLLACALAWWRLLPVAREQHLLRPALAASLLAGLTHSMVSGVLVPAYSQLWVAVVTAFALCEFNEMLTPYGREQARRPQALRQSGSPSKVAAGAAFAVAWIACLGAVLSLVAVELPLVTRFVRAAEQRELSYAPRFWQYGYIDESRSLRAFVEGRPLRKRLKYTLEAALERAHLPFEPD